MRYYAAVGVGSSMVVLFHLLPVSLGADDLHVVWEDELEAQGGLWAAEVPALRSPAVFVDRHPAEPLTVQADGVELLRLTGRHVEDLVAVDLPVGTARVAVTPRAPVVLGERDSVRLEAADARLGLTRRGLHFLPFGLLWAALGALHLVWGRTRADAAGDWFGLCGLVLGLSLIVRFGPLAGVMPFLPGVLVWGLAVTWIGAGLLVQFVVAFCRETGRWAPWLSVSTGVLGVIASIAGTGAVVPMTVLTVGVVVVIARAWGRVPGLPTVAAGLLATIATFVYEVAVGLDVLPAALSGRELRLAVSGLGLAATPLAIVAALGRRNARLLVASERFVPRDFLRALELPDLGDVRPGQRVRREMTLLFSDIRGFTALSERLGAEEMAALVDRVLTVQAEAIHANGGFVDKYIGDAVMALFDEPEAAVRGALACVSAVEALGADVHIGVGLHTGPLLLGTVGSEDRLSCTVMGDTVNLASRVEGLTKTYGATVLLTSAVVADVPCRVVDRVTVKGREEPTELLQPVADGLVAGPEWQTVRTAWNEGRFAEVRDTVAALRPRFPNDPVLPLYADRAEQMCSQPPSHWDGVVRMRQK